MLVKNLSILKQKNSLSLNKLIKLWPTWPFILMSESGTKLSTYIEKIKGQAFISFKWYKRAAEKGYAEAQYMLGLMYDNGEGVPQNYSETFKWYKRAAEQGHADAQYNLGLMYHNGKGVPQNYSEAFKWYKRAAEQGVAEAQNNLGVMYENGEGVTRDLQEAYTYFILAKANGNSDAENNIEAVGRRLSAKQINAAQQKASRLFKLWQPKK
jgi:TPR repeat protein